FAAREIGRRPRPELVWAFEHKRTQPGDPGSLRGLAHRQLPHAWTRRRHGEPDIRLEAVALPECDDSGSSFLTEGNTIILRCTLGDCSECIGIVGVERRLLRWEVMHQYVVGRRDR